MDNVTFFALFLCFASIYLMRQQRKRTHLCDVQSPRKSHWLWGHEKLVWDHDVGYIYDGWVQTLGTVFKVRPAFWQQEILVVTDPASITHILQKRVYDYHHSRVVRPRIERMLGRSLGWVEGEHESKRMRHLVAPSLSAQYIRETGQDISEVTSHTLELLVQRTINDGGSTVINGIDWASRVTLGIIGRVAFGHDFGFGYDDDATKILHAWRGQANFGLQLKGFLALALVRRFPFLNHLPIPMVQAQCLNKITIKQVGRDLLVRKTKEFEGSPETEKKNKDLLSLLMDNYLSGQISEEELLDHIVTFIISGHETTAQTIGHTLWELAKHPDIQTQLRTEIRSFGREPTYDEYQSKLPFLDAVCREILRLHPALPYMERIATKPDVLPLQHPIVADDGKFVSKVAIAADQTVIIPIVSVNRMDLVWGDGHAFRPSRWLEPLPPQNLLCKGFSNTLTFSDGPRNCPGTRLALFQYKVILFNLVRKFRFKETNARIRFNPCSSVQPWVEGQRQLGTNLPVCLELL